MLEVNVKQFVPAFQTTQIFSEHCGLDYLAVAEFDCGARLAGIDQKLCFQVNGFRVRGLMGAVMAYPKGPCSYCI